MEKYLISIIVPVYNTEAFLARCIESVIHQTYSNWELILIDDGSSDNSPVMCDKWAELDKRIRVLHKKNGGASSARNIGLKHMRGQYVTFLDSDDCLTTDCLEESVNAIIRDNLDVVQFYFIEIFSNGDILHHHRLETGICSSDQYIRNGALSGCSCGGMYNADIIRNQNIRYNESLHYLEDAFFVCEVVKNSSRLKRTAGEYYEYHKNPTGSDRPKNWDYYLDSIEYAASYKISNPIFSLMIDDWCTMLAMRYITLAHKHDFPRFAVAWRKLKVDSYYIKHAKRRDIVLFNVLQKYIGVKYASITFRVINKLFYFIKGVKNVK